jgi:hypothetical protein
MTKKRKFEILGVLLKGGSTEDHEHREIFSCIMEGDSAQLVKEDLIKNLTIEIQLADEYGEAIPTSDMSEEEDKIGYDYISINNNPKTKY